MFSCDVGDRVKLTSYNADGEGFKNTAGALTDPATVTLKVKKPDGTVTTYTYASAEITKDAVGRYSYQLTIDQDGVWSYRWIGTGTIVAAEEDAFFVRKSIT